MKVYEFYLKENEKIVFEDLVAMFRGVALVVSRNPQTGWVQILLDDAQDLSLVEGKAKMLSDGRKRKRSCAGMIAPKETFDEADFVDKSINI